MIISTFHNESMEKVILLAHCIHENYIVKYTCILGVTLKWGKKNQQENSLRLENKDDVQR